MHIQCHNPNGILMLNAYSPDWRRQESQKTRFSGNDLHYLLYYPGPPTQFPFASAPPTPHEVVADIVVHVLHLKLFSSDFLNMPSHMVDSAASWPISSQTILES